MPILQCTISNPELLKYDIEKVPIWQLTSFLQLVCLLMIEECTIASHLAWRARPYLRTAWLTSCPMVIQ